MAEILKYCNGKENGMWGWVEERVKGEALEVNGNGLGGKRRC